MTSDKVQQRAIRARMAKTGERYTTARRYHLDLHRATEADETLVNPAPVVALPSLAETAASTPESTTPTELPPRVAEPGMADAAIARGTGKGWDEWVLLLDAWGGTERRHPEIAAYLQAAHGLGGWWAQSVTVGYERARGLRAANQRPDGFLVSIRKTFPVGAERLSTEFVDEARRDAWLEPGTLRLRTSQPARSARFDVVADGTWLQVTFLAKDTAKAAVQIQHERLPTADDVEARRAFWKERLGRLAALMTSARP